MCRMAAIKSKTPVSPALVLRMMLAMQEGHDNSGFAMVMQDLGGAFANFKEFPLLSMACTQFGLDRVEEYLEEHGFTPKFDYQPDVDDRPGLDFQKMPVYVFRNYRYPESYVPRPWKEKKQLLVDTCLALRKLLAEDDQGYVYSFWPDVLTLKEVGDPRDISAYFQMWETGHWLQARVISAHTTLPRQRALAERSPSGSNKLRSPMKSPGTITAHMRSSAVPRDLTISTSPLSMMEKRSPRSPLLRSLRSISGSTGSLCPKNSSA